MNLLFCVFFFKQKTAYEMRISDWSSDVCSSDLMRTFLNVQERAHLAFGLAIHIDGRRVLGQVGVVDEITTHALAFAPTLEAAQVLAQAIGHHGGAFDQC